MRKVIAARMVDAAQTIPHFRLTIDVEVDALLKIRKDLRAANSGAPSVNDFLVKACAGALIEVPALNIQYVDGEIHQFASADISVVMALEGGLSAPIVRGADRKSVWEIAQEVRDLGARAAKNGLKVQEVLGGSFSISNLGMHGIDQFDAIINPPQCAILAVGQARPRVTADSNQQVRVATVIKATLSVDHRAADGALGAAFLASLRRRLENPQQLLEQ